VLPLKDDVPTRSFPLVTVALIVVNVLVYLYEFMLGFPVQPTRAAAAAAQRAYEGFIFEFGLVPCRIGDACPASVLTLVTGAPPAWLTVFTSMFVHGSLFHVGGNMLYLWIFGNNVEDAMTKGRFVVFYVLSGVVAALAQYLGHPGSPVPMIGASGAVSGALGAYLILHPHAHVWTLVGFGWFWRLVPVPAVIVLGFWIVVQLLNTVFTVGSGEPGGVAWLAHVGGFVAGMALVNVFRQRPRASYGRH
jgi:membrane associated rhomboid family serine protease